MSTHPPYRYTLKSALSRSFTLVGLLGVAVSLLAVFATGFILQRDYARDNLHLLTRQAAYSAEVPIVFNDMNGLRDALRPILESNEVEEITVTDSRGAQMLQLVQAKGLMGDDFVPATLIPEPSESPIFSAGSQIGAVKIVSSGHGIGRLIIAAIIGAVGCISLIALGTIAVARRLNQTLVEPLGAIANVAHAVRADGNFERRAPSARIAEVNALADDFNALLSKLHDWQGQISSTHEALLHRASYDLLSGLPNRSTFVERVRDAIRGAQRSDGRFAILFMDGDNFKETNDRFGHAAGDKVIVEVAARLSPLLRAGDIAARMGGDEFAILVNHLESDTNATSVADRIVSSMIKPIPVTPRNDVTISLSIGIAIYPADGDNVDTLIQCADDRMYEAKNQGRTTR